MKITSKKDEEKSFIFMNLFDFWVALKPQQYVHRFFSHLYWTMIQNNFNKTFFLQNIKFSRYVYYNYS